MRGKFCTLSLILVRTSVCRGKSRLQTEWRSRKNLGTRDPKFSKKFVCDGTMPSGDAAKHFAARKARTSRTAVARRKRIGIPSEGCANKAHPLLFCAESFYALFLIWVRTSVCRGKFRLQTEWYCRKHSGTATLNAPRCLFTMELRYRGMRQRAFAVRRARTSRTAGARRKGTGIPYGGCTNKVRPLLFVRGKSAPSLASMRHQPVRECSTHRRNGAPQKNQAPPRT